MSLLFVAVVGTAALASEPSVDTAGNPDERIALTPGTSVVLSLSKPVARTIVTAEDTARVFALDPQTLLVQGVAIGTTDLVVTYTGSDHVDQWDLAVQRDVTPLRRRIQHIVKDRPNPLH